VKYGFHSHYGLDGIVARKTKQGQLGEYLEGMGDMTSMGIAPAIFVFMIYYENISYCIYYQIYLIIALIMFLSLSIIRLASFHIMKKDNYFVGLPASASTVIILILAYLEIEFLYLILIIIYGIAPILLLTAILVYAIAGSIYLLKRK